MSELDPNLCLEPTAFIDSESEAIRNRVESLNVSDRTPAERASAVFEFVRDEIAYDFAAPTDPAAYRASAILANGKGHCVRKAILLCALARAAGVPTALTFADMRDRTLSPAVVTMMGTDVLHHHGLVAFHLDGIWRKVDPTTPRETAERKGFRLVEFDGTADALGAATTAEGDPHLEYVTFYGMHVDMPFVEVMRSLAENYANADSQKFGELGLSASNDFARAAERFGAAP